MTTIVTTLTYIATFVFGMVVQALIAAELEYRRQKKAEQAQALERLLQALEKSKEGQTHGK